MTTEFRVVTPDDMGETIKLGVKEPNKYDVDLSRLDLSVHMDEETVEGTGEASSPYKVRISDGVEGNLLKHGADGLYVSPFDLPIRPVRLVNASGQTVIGFLYDKERYSGL